MWCLSSLSRALFLTIELVFELVEQALKCYFKALRPCERDHLCFPTWMERKPCMHIGTKRFSHNKMVETLTLTFIFRSSLATMFWQPSVLDSIAILLVQVLCFDQNHKMHDYGMFLHSYGGFMKIMHVAISGGRHI